MAETSQEIPKEAILSTSRSRRGWLQAAAGAALAGLVGTNKEKLTTAPKPIFLETRKPAFFLVDKEAEGAPAQPPTPQLPEAAAPNSLSLKWSDEPEKPKELPKDVFSPEELGKLNIHIYRTKDIGLLLQHPALTYDPLVQYAKNINDRYVSQSNISPKFRLDVILLDKERMTGKAEELPEEKDGLGVSTKNLLRMMRQGACSCPTDISCLQKLPAPA